jgi:hypothetical protein
MIKLKTLLEMQMIKEALPLSKAREFASIERNPGIEKHLDLIFEKLKSEPGAKVLNELGRVAIPVNLKPDYYHPSGYLGNLEWEEDHDHSEELWNFADFLSDAKRQINYVIRQFSDKIDSSFTPINDNMHLIDIISGKNFKDQYGREVKMSKYIPYIVTKYYKARNIVNSIENPNEAETDEQLKNTIKEKTNQLLSDYNKIPEVHLRMNSSFQANVQLYIVFSKHSYDVAGMSTDRGWTSCMNIYKGSNKHYIQYDIKEGTIVAYLIKEPDFNIKNPTARIAIKPYVNIEKPDDVFFQPETKIYGTPSVDFNSIVNEIFDKIQPGKTGTFALVDTLYCDSGVRNIEK